MSFSAANFFDDRSLNGRVDIHSAKELWRLLSAEQDAVASDDTELRTLTAGKLLFRGQSDAAYGLSASLHRAMRDDVGKALTESDLYAAELRVRERAGELGVGKGLTELEVQQLLQHHHAPTRLLDASRNPLEALFFATESKDLSDGRLFLIHVDETTERNQQISLDDDDTALPWAKYARGTQQAAAAWTQSVTVVEGRALDPRMIAQDGVFLAGGIQRKYSNLNVLYEGEALDAEKLQAVSMLTIGFHKRARKGMGKQWPAYGWTIRIPAEWKRELRELLREQRIHHRTMYPEFASLQWQTAAAIRDTAI